MEEPRVSRRKQQNENDCETGGDMYDLHRWSSNVLQNKGIYVMEGRETEGSWRDSSWFRKLKLIALTTRKQRRVGDLVKFPSITLRKEYRANVMKFETQMKSVRRRV